MMEFEEGELGDLEFGEKSVEIGVVNTLITCSCKMFEECGLLCRHCLRIFHMHSVQKIPDCYIKRR
ncbi:hypothetical protein CASFOL_025809 [Castilleja foliolosa]|uniref:SWIM-type domain-containing protein n=1 Tax=Castilleja foliolosa TaxID=1961234 RepID=A0ABD3CS71_9LAMI